VPEIPSQLGHHPADPRRGRLLEFSGRIPTKKNEKAIAPDAATGKMKLWYAREDRQRISELVQYAVIQWRDRNGRLPALEHPALCFEFSVLGSAELSRPRYRKDRDNMLTTLLDVLKTAGVLVDDDIAHCNGPLVVLPAVIGPTQGARVWIE